MARIPYVAPETAPEAVRELFGKMEAGGASVLNLWRMAAHAPVAMPHLLRLGSALLTKTSLEAMLRELAIVRVAEIYNCEYERQAHTAWLRSLGMAAEKIAAIRCWEESELFSPDERTVLRYTDELSREGRVSDDCFLEAEKLLGHQGAMELAVTAGYYGMLARLLLNFEVDMESGGIGSPEDIVGRRP
ncbi:carboxymuconolactone decarboxylase family protein [Chloroflexota bacterium]